jgi:hypothetical protein
VPSLYSPDKFKCYTDLEKVGVIIGITLSVLSSFFSVYKFQIFVRKRAQKLQAASIKPTLKRIVFLQRTLANQSKLMLLSHADQTGFLDDSRPASERGVEMVAPLVRDVQRQLQEQLKQMQGQLQQQQQQQQEQQELGRLVHDIQRQLQEQLQQMQGQLQQQQQQQRQLQQLLQEQLQQQRQEMQQLRQQLQQQQQ